MSWFGASKNPIPPSVRKMYRINGTDVYEVECVPQSDGTIRLYCRRHPPIPSTRSTNVRVCHLYGDKRICIASGHEPRSLDKAQAIAMFFCRGFSEFIRTGSFPNGAARINV